MFSDSRIKGEHPKCEDIQDEIKHMLFVMSDEQIRDLINNADEDRKEQLEYPIECILPSNIKEIDNHVMRNYMDSLATYVEKEARSVSNAAELLRERKIDFED